MRFRLCLNSIVWLLWFPVHAATFYVSNSGNDSASGLSEKAAWRSLEKVNAYSLQPGDKVLFQGGATFKGSLELTREDSGTSEGWVVIGSFGNDRATLEPGQKTGIWARDTARLRIENLVVNGDGPSVNRGYGVLIENTSTNNMLPGLQIDSVEVNGFGQHGIMVTGAHYGYEDVIITRCSMRANLRGGMEVAGKLPWDANRYAHKNVVVSESRAFDNPGDPNYGQNHSGSGIVLYQVDTGRIEKCAAWNNGASCPAAGGGPVGIWTCASRRVVIEYCESFSNRTRGLDGGGFDIDGGSEDCVLQYNYSHDNQGPGLMVYTYPYASHRDRGNIVRFNVSVNDAVQSDRYAGLWIRADGRKMEGIEVYNNSVISSGPQTAFIHATDVAVRLRNNLFLNTTVGVPLRVEGATNGLVRLEHNLYWGEQGTILAQWNGRLLRSLKEFREVSGQEVAGPQELGAFEDPQLVNYTTRNSTPLENLRGLAQFRPQSQFVGAGGKNFPGHYSDGLSDFLGQEIGEIVPLGAVRSGSSRP